MLVEASVRCRLRYKRPRPATANLLLAQRVFDDPASSNNRVGALMQSSPEPQAMTDKGKQEELCAFQKRKDQKRRQILER